MATGQDLKAEISLGPAGSAGNTRGNASSLLNATDGGTITWTVNPVAGQTVLVGVTCGTGETITSLTDNGASPTTFTLDSSESANGTTTNIYRASNISLPASGSYAVAVTASGGFHVTAGGVAYSGLRAGAPAATNVGTSAGGTSVSTGTVTPAAAGALYFAVFGDGTSLNPETITLTGAGFTSQFSQTNGTGHCGGIADKIDTGGPAATSCTWTLGDSVAWSAVIAVYDKAWTDISAYVYQRDTVTVQRGRPNEASSMQPGQATLTLNNRDGRFTTRNPVGAYWPSLVQNTPLRLSVPVADAGLSNYLRFEGDSTSSATTPDKAGLQITGPIDIRVDCWPSDYQPTILAAKYGGTAQSWAFVLGFDFNSPFFNVASNIVGSGTLAFYWFDGANTQALACNQLLPYFGQRICLRVLFTPSTGTAQFYTAPTMAGPFTQLGTNQVFGATTLSAGAGQPVQVGGAMSLARAGHSAASFTSVLGMVYEAQVLSNVTLEADPVFSSQTAGATSFTDAQSNTWTLAGTSEISGRLYRFHGETGSFPKAADPSATDVYSQATAVGITQRLQNSNTPLQSPMRRAYVRLPSSLNIGAYWPCEDAAGSKSLGSALGGTPMQISGTPTLASNSDFVCSAPLPVMNGATFTGVVPPGYGGNDASVRFLWEVPAGGEANNSTVVTVNYSGGAAAYATLVYTTGGFLNWTAFNSSGGTLHSTGNVSFGVNGHKLRVAVDLKKNSTNVDMTIATLAVGGATATVFTATAAFAGAVGQVSQIMPGSSGITGSVMGHFSVQGTADAIFDVSGPLVAWNSEPAATRVARLCSEEGIPCRIVGASTVSLPMGNQPIDTLMNILTQCEQTDLGFLFEPRQALGIGFRTRSSLYHQSPLATASYSSAQIYQGFAATGDTQITVNDVTATAPSGSTARQFLATGAMSVLAPPNGIGRVETSISPSPQLDSALNQIANWYLSVRSVDDDRYPAIPFQMPRTSTPSAVALLDIGDYLQITGTPAWLPPGPVKQLCAGFAETWFPAAYWLLNINGIPELPYETAQAGAAAGTAGNAKADTAGSQLTSSITSSATSFQVTTTAGPVWTQTGLQFPFDIVIDREQMTVSAVTSATSPQTFTISARSVNGVVMAHSAAAAVSLYRKPVAAL